MLQFNDFMNAAYYSVFNDFNVKQFVGTFTVNRYRFETELLALYGSQEAVDVLLEDSSRDYEAACKLAYMNRCTGAMCYNSSISMTTVKNAKLMTLPCSTATSGWSNCHITLPENTLVTVTGKIVNSEGNLWYKINYEGLELYVYSKNVKASEEEKSWTSPFQWIPFAGKQR